uniref:LRRCT domain-containing protein n=1 Tax=Acanthochromis polyacanthus TaxID=80966 RepID=A0A3Q1G0H1_9TELE
MQHLVWLILAMQWMVEGVENCPDICKCSKKAGPEKSEVNCHKRGLHAFPSNLPPDAWILKLGEFLWDLISVIICLFLVSELRKLYLHDNPWQCDCNIISLVRWMGQTKTTLSPREALKCVSPPELRNKRLGSLEAGKLKDTFGLLFVHFTCFLCHFSKLQCDQYIAGQCILKRGIIMFSAKYIKKSYL